MPTVDGKPEMVRMCDIDWYVYAKRDCALDINKDARLAMDIGWKYIYIKALKQPHHTVGMLSS